MNVFVVLSLDSGLPVFHKQTVPGQKTKNSQSVEESQRAERDIMHVTSLLYALRKIASSIDHQEQTRGSGRHRLGHLHHMQQVSLYQPLLLHSY